MRDQWYIRMMDDTPSDIIVPSDPHFIIGNHMHSHFGLGGYFTLALSVPEQVKIVCNNSQWYANRVYCVGSMIQRILSNEINIDRELLYNEKEESMVSQIEHAFASGYSVVMLVDAWKEQSPMRALYMAVLKRFPNTRKQVLHIKRPLCAYTFRFQRYPAVYDIDTVIAYRKEILRETNASS